MGGVRGSRPTASEITSVKKPEECEGNKIVDAMIE